MSVGSFKAFGSTIASDTKIFVMPKNVRRTHEGSISYRIRMYILTFAKPSWGHLSKLGLHRTPVVWSSAPSARVCYTKAIQWRHDVARLCNEGITTSYSLRYAIELASFLNKFRTRWHLDGHMILTKTVLSAFPIFPTVTWTYKNQYPHSIFSQKSWWVLLVLFWQKSWRISRTRQSVRRRLQHCFWTRTWNMIHVINTSCRRNRISYRYLFIIMFFFQAAPGFLSRREVNSWPGVEPWREIFEWGAIFSQHPLPGLVGISNSNFKRKKLTKMLYVFGINIWFLHYIVKSLYAFGTLSGIYFTPHDAVNPSCTNRINIVCQTTTSYMLRERFEYNMLYSCVHLVTIGMLLSFIFIRTCFGSKLAFFT